MASEEFFTERGLWVRRRGSGDRVLVLLHGMGANGAVWSRLISVLAARWSGRVLVPDLRGHGRSVAQAPYDIATHSADIAALISGETSQSVLLLGHSFGGAVAALAASAEFAVCAEHVFAIGVKLRWTEEEIARAHELAGRPARTFPTREEALEGYLKISGLAGLAEPTSEAAAAGVAGDEGAWRVAVDPRVFEAVGPSVREILRSCAAPLHLAAGEKDPMVSIQAMRAIDPSAVTFATRGHNVHWEAPEDVRAFMNSRIV